MLALVPAAASAGQCSARSPAHTVALVELYTSQGCSSCPPADRWLSSLAGQGFGGDRVVPVALHVDYWDYIGWKDPYAREAHSNRQRKMARLARAAFVYTPQVVLQGRDFRAWGSSAFADEVARINARPARADLAVQLEDGTAGGFRVRLEAALRAPAGVSDPAVFLGTYENKLLTEVKNGENAGKTLSHDYVVLAWEGPLELKGGRLEVDRVLPLLPKAVRGNSGVAAFVQNRATGEVLQALMRPACPGS